MSRLAAERRASLVEHRDFIRGRIAALRAETRLDNADDDRKRLRERAVFTYVWALRRLDWELSVDE